MSSLIFFFAMETSWKHHGNFWFTAIIARLSQNEHDKHFPLDDAGRETRSRRWAGGPGKEGEPSPCSGLRYTHAPHLTRIVRRPIFSEGASRESGLPSRLAAPSRCTQSFSVPWKHMETYGNTLETYGKHMGNCFHQLRTEC